MSAFVRSLPAPFFSRPCPGATTHRGLRRLRVLAIFLVAYFAMEIASYREKSATYDEPLHLAAGYAALTKHEHRLDPTHPPLVRLWAALPLLFMPGVDFDTTRFDGLTQEVWMPRQNTYAHEFLYVRHDADFLLNWARGMIVVLGALLGVLIFFWAEAMLGFATAVLALLFYLLSPNLGAHASLVTTDLGVTCFYFGTIFFLWRLQRRFSAGNVGGFVLCFALAVVSKFSALLLAPTVAVLLAWIVWRRGPVTGRHAAGLVGLLIATTWAAIWAVYGFRFAPSAAPGVLLHTWDSAEVNARLPVIAPLLNGIDARHLLPNAFTQGFLMCFAWSEALPGYLAGEISRTGWWYYYPIAFAVKTPAVLLVLLAGGLGALLVRRRGAQDGSAWFLLLPVAIYGGVAMGTHIHIGLRHILPVYPFVLMIAAVAVREILDSAWHARTKWLVLGPLVGFWIVTFGSVYPFTLTFFNQFVGGPEHGAEYLADSNLDWGQHLKRLKSWMDRRGVKRINLAYFGTADPGYHGIQGVLLPGARDFMEARIARPELPGYVAIGETVASGVYLRPEWRLFYGGFDKLEPVAQIGNALRIYWVEQWPESAESLPDDRLVWHRMLGDRLSRLGWHRHAIHHYRELLRHRPNDALTKAHLASALLDSGRMAEAEPAFRQAIQLAPENGDLRDEFAVLLIQQGRFREAIPHADTLARLKPHEARAHDLLGVALAGDRHSTEAAREFEWALKIDPGDAAIREHLELVRPPGQASRH